MASEKYIEVRTHFFDYFKTHNTFMGVHVLTIPDHLKNTKKEWLIIEDMFKSLVPSAKEDKLQYMVDEELIIVFNRNDADLLEMINQHGTFAATTYGGPYCDLGENLLPYSPELFGPVGTVDIGIVPEPTEVNNNNITLFWDNEYETATLYIDNNVAVTFFKPE
jgi:hypothetical protein